MRKTFVARRGSMCVAIPPFYQGGGQEWVVLKSILTIKTLLSLDQSRLLGMLKECFDHDHEFNA